MKMSFTLALAYPCSSHKKEKEGRRKAGRELFGTHGSITPALGCAFSPKYWNL